MTGTDLAMAPGRLSVASRELGLSAGWLVKTDAGQEQKAANTSLGVCPPSPPAARNVRGRKEMANSNLIHPAASLRKARR